MPERNEQKAPALSPALKETIAVLRKENSPKNLNSVINELVKSPLLTPAVFDIKGAPAPKPGPDGRVQLPKDTKISLVMLNSKDDTLLSGFQRLGCSTCMAKNGRSGTSDHDAAL